ncbi:signal transduction histidine kinase [Streptacidiphilus sp. MAP12-33]|uniref:sensor histidine kinase n=1 Tax=Streptacidiphilus sp. MAP12-33 TaxID=3156266 RepID=UPI0035111605
MNCHYRYSVRSRNGDLTLLWRPGRDDAPDTFLVDAHARPLAFADERSLAAHCERHALVLVPGGEADLDLVAVREWVHRPQLDPAVAGLLLAGAVATVTVDDAGPGIPPGVADSLFERFRSGSGSTGLGLSIASWVARAHDGRLTAGASPQGGARFTLRIPAREGE